MSQILFNNEKQVVVYAFPQFANQEIDVRSYCYMNTLRDLGFKVKTMYKWSKEGMFGREKGWTMTAPEGFDWEMCKHLYNKTFGMTVGQKECELL